MKWTRWLAEHWYLFAILAFGAAALAYVLGGDSGRAWASKLLKSRTAVVEAKRDGKALGIKHGATEAIARIEINHAETIDDLDEKERAQVDRLRSNPARLSSELTRMGLRRAAAREAASRTAENR